MGILLGKKKKKNLPNLFFSSLLRQHTIFFGLILCTSYSDSALQVLKGTLLKTLMPFWLPTSEMLILR